MLKIKEGLSLNKIGGTKMKEYIRGFDVNRRIAIPREILEKLNIDYETDQMKIVIKDGKIILRKYSMVEEKKSVNAPDMVKAYYEIEKLENKKENLIKQYSLKYNLKISKVREIIVSGGSKLVDALLHKIIKSDEQLDQIIILNESIASWTDYLNKEIELYLKNDDPTPVIVFLKEHKDLKTGKSRTFRDIAKMTYLSERTVKRRYYDYKNDIK